MKKGCVIGLLTWVVAGGAYWVFLHQRFGPPLDVIVPVVAGFLMALAIGSFRIALDSAITSVRAGQQSNVIGEKPRDGQMVTTSGHIRASGSTLRTPFTDSPAVLYSYEVSRTYSDHDGVRTARDFAGFAMGPSVIDTRYGPLRLLSFPLIDGFGTRVESSEANLAKVQEYINNTQFKDMSGFKAVSIFSEMSELYADNEGQVRKDWRMTGDAQVSSDVDLVERVVAPGEQVTVIGRYSAEKNGLVPEAGRSLQLMRGDAQISASALRGKAVQALIASLIVAAVVNGILFFVLMASHGKPIAFARSRQQARHDVDALHNASRNGDLTAVQSAVAGGMQVDARDDEGMTPLMRAPDAKTAAWLIAHGADVNATDRNGDTALMEQARAGHADVVQVLVKSGAKLDTRSPQWKTTALQQALDAEQLEVATILRDAGAHDDTVTEKNGHSINERSEPMRAVKAFLDAIQRADLPALNAVSTHVTAEKDAYFRTWKDALPATARVVSGFANDDAATIAIRGQVTGGKYATWTFQLVHVADGWKVASDRWESRLDSKEP